MSLAESARHYWNEPTLAHFLALREQIVASANYSPYTSAQEVAAPHLAAADYEQIIRHLRPLLPGAFLSPALHNLLALAYHQVGDQAAAVREARFAQAALSGILLTGEGTREQPYLVLRIEDEYALLTHLSKKSVVQTLIEAEGRAFDQHTCSDGSQVWFDISAFFTPTAMS